MNIDTEPPPARNFNLFNGREIRRNDVIHLCEFLQEERVDGALKVLRRGYPQLEHPNVSECVGEEFRIQSDIVTGRLVERFFENLDSFGKENGRITVILPLRAGVAFAKHFLEARKNGRNINFVLSDISRDEDTAEPIDREQFGEIEESDIVEVADPMFATGGTIAASLSLAKKAGVKESRLHVLSVVAAPIGIKKVKNEFKEVSILTAAIDDKLNGDAYIVPGLGDYGNKWCANLSDKEIILLMDLCDNKYVFLKILRRFKMVDEEDGDRKQEFSKLFSMYKQMEKRRKTAQPNW